MTLSLIACFWLMIHFVGLYIFVSLGHLSFGGMIGNGSIILVTQGHGSVWIPEGVNFNYYFYRNLSSDPIDSDQFPPGASAPKLTETVRGEFDFEARSGPHFKFSITLPFWVFFILVVILLILPTWNRSTQHDRDDKPDIAVS